MIAHLAAEMRPRFAPELERGLMAHLRRTFAGWHQSAVLVAVVAESRNVVIVAKLPGDPLALRGIPVVARGVSGASPGTNPEAACVR